MWKTWRQAYDGNSPKKPLASLTIARYLSMHAGELNLDLN